MKLRYLIGSIILCFSFPVLRAGGMIVLTADKMQGGGMTPAFSFHFDRYDVNAVYATSSGEKSMMTGSFELEKIPLYPTLELDAHAFPEKPFCEIRISINGKAIFTGDAGFTGKDWEIREFIIPEGILVSGKNKLQIQNIMQEGNAGTPPWLIISRVGIGEKNDGIVAAHDLFENFYITLPDRKKDFASGNNGNAPGFKLRGIKGWNWTPEQTMEEIPYLKQFHMNFFMNCYTSMYDHPNPNEWWKPYPDDFKKKYEKIVSLCKENDIEFCFALNPNFMAEKAFDYDNKEHFAMIWKHYEWMAGLGVNWFSVCLDDIEKGLDASGQARFVNALLKKIRKKNPQAQMILCPSIYAGTYVVGGVNNDQYLHTLARELDPDVYCFWTGDYFCGPITAGKMKQVRDILKHRLIVWDNYPVNDGYPSMNLGPVVLRDKELLSICDGYMANPMRTQNQMGRIPLYTIADFAWDPQNYDPAESIGQAILHLSENREQAKTLKNVVEVYFGFLLSQKENYWYARNTARYTFEKLMNQPHSKVPVSLWVDHMEELLAGLEKNFPGMYQAECNTIRQDIDWMKKKMKTKYP